MKSIKSMNFTKTAIAKIQPSDRRELIYDTIEQNLALAVNPGGKKSYLLVMSVNNRAVKRKLGNANDLSITEARTEAAKLRISIRTTGKVPAKNARSGEPTVRDLYDDYMNRYAKVYLKNWKYLEQYWNSHLAQFASVKAAELSTAMVEDWFRGVTQNSGKHMANRLRTFLGTIYNRAAKQNLYRGMNPINGVEPHKEKSRDRYLTGDELTILAQKLADESCHGFRSFMKLSLLTGARFSNVVGMKWKDLNLNCTQPTWTIPAEEMKNATSAVLPLSDRAVAIIREHDRAERGEYVLHDCPALKTIKRRWRATFDRFVTRSGLTDFRIHDLRRTYGSIMAQEGISLHIIARALGQNSTRATPVYARLSARPVRDAVQVAEARLPF